MDEVNKPIKKKYEAPDIAYEEVVEAIAGVCSSTFDTIDTCRYSGPSCDAPQH